MEDSSEVAIRLAGKIAETKEEILTAFIAKWGWEPDRIVMIDQRKEDGLFRFYIKRLDDIEYTEVTNLKRRVKDLEEALKDIAKGDMIEYGCYETAKNALKGFTED